MTVPPAIGGVMPAEPPGEPIADSLWDRWSAGWSHWAAFRTARSALAALLSARNIRRVWLPAYICESATAGAAGSGAEVGYYAVGRTLEVEAADLAKRLAPGDAVLGVDYFGRPPGPAFLALREQRRDVLWIEDRAQALETGAASWGDVILYSPRKLVGVADGGLLFSNVPLPAPEAGPDDPEIWAPERARARDPDGRSPGAWYPVFQAREAGYGLDRVAASGRTLAALKALEAAPLIEARRRNWRTLATHLGRIALWPDADPAFAPLAFPILTADASGLVQALADQAIWCPRHWATLPAGTAGFADATWLSERLVSLPCDPRYGEADMARLAAAVLAAL